MLDTNSWVLSGYTPKTGPQGLQIVRSDNGIKDATFKKYFGLDPLPVLKAGTETIKVFVPLLKIMAEHGTGLATWFQSGGVYINAPGFNKDKAKVLPASLYLEWISKHPKCVGEITEYGKSNALGMKIGLKLEAVAKPASKEKAGQVDAMIAAFSKKPASFMDL